MNALNETDCTIPETKIGSGTVVSLAISSKRRKDTNYWSVAVEEMYAEALLGILDGIRDLERRGDVVEWKKRRIWNALLCKRCMH
ncbi:hypothetical protein OPV22_001467 [Ensete ventricosum]|uniref:RNase H type-1 domain-containing protein n=1 Tax=Ensete ventricosum TaxID=4639 RepID=A0AAV8RWA1_ENSVE|nr:hypothetical protein OPV22_001467 [Ensete ventricosum]